MKNNYVDQVRELQNVVVHEEIRSALAVIEKARVLIGRLPRAEETKVDALTKLQKAYDALKAIKL